MKVPGRPGASETTSQQVHMHMRDTSHASWLRGRRSSPGVRQHTGGGLPCFRGGGPHGRNFSVFDRILRTDPVFPYF